MKTNEVLNTVRDRLQEFDIRFDEAESPTGPLVTLSRAGHRQQYAAVVAEPMTLSSVIRGHRTPASSFTELVIGHRVSRRSAAAFREAGIQFVDALGNASIRFGNVLIEVQGRTDSGVRPTDARNDPARPPANIFSSRRAQVILVLLTWPDLSTATVRDIAEAAGVSTGQAHDTLGQLEQTGFVVPGSRRLDRAEELLDLWTAAYPTGLGRRLELGRFHGDPATPVQGLAADRSWHLSSESARASGVLRPATLTVYLDHLDRRLPALNRWDADTDRPPNIFVRRQFWKSPSGEDEPAPAGRNAPWPLVYADLLATRDARLSEVARTWRVRHGRPGDV